MRPAVLWLLVVAAYVAFFAWYRGSAEPLTADEIDDYMARFEEGDRDSERLAEMRKFLEADDGGDFIMVNAVELHEKPVQTGAVRPGETSEQVLGRYMEFMWPALLSRACHPVVVGDAYLTVEAWGIENAETWSFAGLMRYRSRRDLMDIATNPAFSDAHQYKVAAMSKTFAFAIAPEINLGDPRILVGLLLFSVGALLHLLFARRPAAG